MLLTSSLHDLFAEMRALTSYDNGNHVTTSAIVISSDTDGIDASAKQSAKRRLCARRNPAVLPFGGARRGRHAHNNGGSAEAGGVGRHCGVQRDSDAGSSGAGCSNNASRMRAKKRSVQMLSAVVIEFFVCWTPIYVLNTWSVFDYMSAVEHVSGTAMNFIHLLAFVSSCCNPVTYCFMSAKFRQGFVAAFRCCCCFWCPGGGRSQSSSRRAGSGGYRVGRGLSGGDGAIRNGACPALRGCCRGGMDDGGRFSPDAGGSLVDVGDGGHRRGRRGLRPTSSSLSSTMNSQRTTRMNVEVTHF